MSDTVAISPQIESKIMNLHSRLEEVVASNRRRQFNTAVVMGCLLLAAALYLWYLYSKIAEFADARTLVELVAAQVEPQLNMEAGRFGDILEGQAPTVMEKAEQALLAAPPQIAREVENYASGLVDKQLQTLETQAYDVIRQTLEASMAKAREDGVDLKDEKQLDALVASAAPVMRDALTKEIDKLYSEYSDGADGMVAYIENLVVGGDGKKLSPLQQSQREILLTGLAIIKKLEADPERSPVKQVIDSLK